MRDFQGRADKPGDRRLQQPGEVTFCPDITCSSRVCSHPHRIPVGSKLFLMGTPAHGEPSKSCAGWPGVITLLHSLKIFPSSFFSLDRRRLNRSRLSFCLRAIGSSSKKILPTLSEWRTFNGQPSLDSVTVMTKSPGSRRPFSVKGSLHALLCSHTPERAGITSISSIGSGEAGSGSRSIRPRMVIRGFLPKLAGDKFYHQERQR